MFLNYARFDPGPAFVGVHLENVVEIFGRVENDGMTHGLSCQARSAAAGKQGNAEFARDLDRCKDIFGGTGDNDADRLDLVDAGVRAVHQPGSSIETNFAGKPVFKRFFQIPH